MEKPEIICMCGSTRFGDLMSIASWELEKLGKIVLRVNYLPQWYGEFKGYNENAHYADQEGLKEKLDELHFKKIDMCDRVYVCNYHGYVGESTRNEINYAESVGKPITYLVEDKNEISNVMWNIIDWAEAKADICRAPA